MTPPGMVSVEAHPFYDRRRVVRSWVYFVEAIGTDRLKIGWTSATNPQARVHHLQTACPFPLELRLAMAASRDDELKIHRRFAALLVAGTREWFHLRGSIAEAIDAGAVEMAKSLGIHTILVPSGDRA